MRYSLLAFCLFFAATSCKHPTPAELSEHPDAYNSEEKNIIGFIAKFHVKEVIGGKHDKWYSNEYFFQVFVDAKSKDGKFSKQYLHSRRTEAVKVERGKIQQDFQMEASQSTLRFSSNNFNAVISAAVNDSNKRAEELDFYIGFVMWEADKVPPTVFDHNDKIATSKALFIKPYRDAEETGTLTLENDGASAKIEYTFYPKDYGFSRKDYK